MSVPGELALHRPHHPPLRLPAVLLRSNRNRLATGPIRAFSHGIKGSPRRASRALSLPGMAIRAVGGGAHAAVATGIIPLTTAVDSVDYLCLLTRMHQKFNAKG